MTNKPIGGYFSLETNSGKELHANAIHLNAGRYALEYILKARRYRKIYIPYYICESVLQPILRLGVEYEFYHINEQLEPAAKLYPADDEAILYVNYFGLKDNYINTFCNTYRNIILDFTQAFYSKPIDNSKEGFQCDTFYSCRKFFGVSDGAYLYTNCQLQEDLPQDESFERMTYLMKRIDRSPQEAYEDFHANDKSLSLVGLRSMSKLTETIMHGIDYTAKANRRNHNFRILDEALGAVNRFKWVMNRNMVPLVYPYYVKNGAQLRQYLINNQIFCARYWPNVYEWCTPEDMEYEFTENIVCIPIDQRYQEEDMERIIEIIKYNYGNSAI